MAFHNQVTPLSLTKPDRSVMQNVSVLSRHEAKVPTDDVIRG
jgi:hypothetical protein